MNDREKIINRIITHFQANRGKSCTYCKNMDIILNIVTSVIKNLNNKQKDKSIAIIVNDYNNRMQILNEIKQEIIENEYNIRCITKDYTNPKYKFDYNFVFIIGIQDIDYIRIFEKKSKFTLCIFTEETDFDSIADILPYIDLSKYNIGNNIINVDSPIEEYRYEVELTTDEYELYNKYNDYITKCMSIFENDDNAIEKCKRGDIENNISAAQYREQLAVKCGWSPNLDTTIDYMKDIDDAFNPNAILESANNVFNISRERKNLVMNNKSKLNIILNICEENNGKKILIVSKNAEFAHEITKYINKNSVFECRDYHDCIEDAESFDDNGKLKVYKSGPNKGQPRILKAKAQCTNNEKLYNKNVINILSLKCASDVSLNVECDIIIFTSPYCDNIFKFNKRFNNVKFISNPIKTYKLYTLNTIEQRELCDTNYNGKIDIIEL